MAEPLLIIGSYLSPYVRKALVMLELKGVEYRVDPIVPFFGNEAFERLSPLRQVPVLVDGDLVLNDSSVICQYIEERYPEPALYPSDIAVRARARWIEEFADSRMGQVVIWQLFDQLVIGRGVWGREPDQAVLTKTYEQDLPAVFDYLEAQMPASGWLFGELSIADISVACFMRNAQFARYQLDAQRWPKLAALLDAAFALPAFQRLNVFERAIARTPILQQREALLAAGAPVSEVCHLREQPVRGPMSRN
ncbi:glutathione S-transferase family protein [Pseudomonas sp. ZM23]|uniref:Glutathione S-transferase family protein n=1 Tax=Pseudomonas triclosanedens TaxID=2961893 RepID=A0ABY6ZZA9_9PSED|nr:glutathione S-transferase family protein [Pseudomonas triclosanedens]MCP8463009.1 glutathione S-transferase family protein [Pseudomonas triclosanedens]MCP8468629.1 glutathione S-transferase family protein [Pseudomonas triclosanedens]MCP8475351.1 glutathione S-transferase family protein [Pseudomonas triclosanedens]WAI50183.1 glutathione S-transferase family protein [Pseudomonas triclosanedens]